MSSQLYRSEKNKVISGVCGGIGDYFNIDPTIVRIVWALVTVIQAGLGFLAYIVCALIIPNEYDAEFYGKKEYDFDKSDSGTSYNKNHKRNTLTIGIILVGIGSLLIVRRFYTWIDFDYLWPGLLILAGIFIIFKRRK